SIHRSPSDMATSGFHFVPCDTKRTSRQLGAPAVGRAEGSSAKVDLKSGLEECAAALNLFLSNRFKDALELLRPWAKESMYHALGYSTIVVLQAVMTFEQQDIQNGISAMKDALQTCQKYRKKCTVVESFSSLLSRGSLEQLSEGKSPPSLRTRAGTCRPRVFQRQSMRLNGRYVFLPGNPMW
uniref:Tetratricopeptide repeat domain 39B n=1 Tax=Rattus norvegicus TaxID=10116 RepID=A0ABK0LTT6_RAT